MNTHESTQSCAAEHFPVFPPRLLTSQASVRREHSHGPASVSLFYIQRSVEEDSMVHGKLVARIYYSPVTKKAFSVSWWTAGCTPKAETTRSPHIPEGISVCMQQEITYWEGE